MLKLQYQAKYLKIIRVPNKDMHKSLQEFDFWHIQTADIVELIGPEKRIALLLENHSKYFNDFTWWLSGERLLPFGLLVPLFLQFFFSQIPKHWIFGHTFLWGLQSWNLIHTWAKGWSVVYTKYKQPEYTCFFIFLLFAVSPVGKD